MTLTGLVNKPGITVLPLWSWFRGGVWLCRRGQWVAPK